MSQGDKTLTKISKKIEKTQIRKVENFEEVGDPFSDNLTKCLMENNYYEAIETIDDFLRKINYKEIGVNLLKQNLKKKIS